ncbi:MAG: Ribosomal RNA small subunit methyltransferase H [Parcubacteria group bacterium GW2011_GWB1_41_6]|nr:MAG: Ribosomal RNA small subunit methyltransferase H [Parcubacteria group bacterium GW2011_GWB1_41_6]KKS33892.1 MAG: Ribosomal RNA small subunit methyltransferase H [Parcubacteria group bacterium GW2011_GWC2_42_13]
MHKPVLLKEVMEALEPKPGETVLDATIDGGGHAIPIVKKIYPKGILVGIDQDVELLERLKSEKNIILLNGNFRDLDKLFEKEKIKSINKALFDLGISSWHLESSGRGFSFQKNEPLDMRYSPESETAANLINKFSEKELTDILKKYGEERFAGSIVRKICETRKKNPIKTTFELIEIISQAVPDWYKRRRLHFATKTFQALRIAVNDELESLKEGMDKAWRFLEPGGRIAVISFHSLEDRIVKNFFREKALAGEGRILTKKPILPSREELRVNPRARSAKLRAGEKI